MDNNQDIEQIGKELQEREAKDKLKEAYWLLIKILNKYLDLKPEYYDIIALWILGTYFHKQFITYPYLFLNAMKGSGKSRALKLITYLSYNGELMNSISESVLFRTAENHMIGIDEAEHIGSKEKNALRELLNSAYKQGAKVKRAFKVKGKEREGYQIEEFNVFCPVALANIWGMDEVLGDRCLTLILEKSAKKEITRMIELFDFDEDIKKFKEFVEFCRVISVKGGIIYINKALGWNDYINKYLPNSTTILTLPNTTTLYQNEFYEKVWRTSLDGRYLELFLPLYILADDLGYLDEIIRISEQIVIEKKEEDVMEARDISLLNFISTYQETGDFILMKELTAKFKELEEEEWINSKWFGRALRRLGLVKKKRKVQGRVEVILNFDKAKEKIKMFGIEIKEEPKVEQETLSDKPNEELKNEERM